MLVGAVSSVSFRYTAKFLIQHQDVFTPWSPTS
ncbi:MAG: hypothetical protein E7531_03830 [Ruminococcaceae bacterium]|nr:hypothetical protein [Oscillospiraceae bacterium]